MSKIISFPTGEETISKEEWAKEALAAIMKADKVAIILDVPNEGEVWTAYHNCDCVDKQVMLGHMQIDIMHQVMMATYELEPSED